MSQAAKDTTTTAAATAPGGASAAAAAAAPVPNPLAFPPPEEVPFDDPYQFPRNPNPAQALEYMKTIEVPGWGENGSQNVTQKDGGSPTHGGSETNQARVVVDMTRDNDENDGTGNGISPLPPPFGGGADGSTAVSAGACAAPARPDNPIQSVIRRCFHKLHDEFIKSSLQQRDWMIGVSRYTAKASKQYMDKQKAVINEQAEKDRERVRGLAKHVNDANQVNFRNITSIRGGQEQLAKSLRELRANQESFSETQARSVQVIKDTMENRVGLVKQITEVTTAFEGHQKRLENLEEAAARAPVAPTITERVVYADTEKPTWAKELEQSVQQQLLDARNWNLDLSSQLNATQSTLEDNQNRLDEAQTLLEDSRNYLQDTRSTLDDTRAQLTETKALLKTTLSHLDETRSQFKESQAQVAETRAQLDRAQSQIAVRDEQLRQHKEQLAEFKSSNRTTAIGSRKAKIDEYLNTKSTTTTGPGDTQSLIQSIRNKLQKSKDLKREEKQQKSAPQPSNESPSTELRKRPQAVSPEEPIPETFPPPKKRRLRDFFDADENAAIRGVSPSTLDETYV